MESVNGMEPIKPMQKDRISILIVMPGCAGASVQPRHLCMRERFSHTGLLISRKVRLALCARRGGGRRPASPPPKIDSPLPFPHFTQPCASTEGVEIVVSYGGFLATYRLYQIAQPTMGGIHFQTRMPHLGYGETLGMDGKLEGVRRNS